MKLTLFKNIEQKPSPITAVSSNNSTIVVFRANGTLELIDSYTFRSYLVMEFSYKILSSALLTFDTVVCGSRCGKLVFFDMRTLETTCIDIGCRAIKIAAKTGFGCRWDAFYYSTSDGEVYERRGMESLLLYRDTSITTSLLVSSTGSLIMGNADGRVKVFEDGRIVCELGISSQRVNMICSLMGNKYSAVCDDGSFSYFDVEMGLVLQRTSVRDSPLNVCVYVADKLHLSGADSRIIAFSRSNDKFIKSYQVDTHYAEVRDIEVDNDRILTVGDDSILSVVWPTADKYLANKVFHKCVELGTSKVDESFYINNFDTIDFYSFDVTNDDGKDVLDEKGFSTNAEEQSNEDREVTFKLSESSCGRIGYKRREYRHRIRIVVEGRAYSSSASSGFTHIAYSNSKETKIASLSPSRKVEIDNGFVLDPANKLLLAKNLIILQNYKYEVLLVDIFTRHLVLKIDVDDHRETLHYVKDLLILGYSKTIYAMKDADRPSKLRISDDVIDVCEWDDDNLLVLSLARSTEAKRKYTFYRVLLSDYTPIHVKSLETYALISSIFQLEGKICFFTSNAVHILDKDMAEEKYPLGAVIYGCNAMGDGIMAIQDSWSNIRLTLPTGVFKEKFSNK